MTLIPIGTLIYQVVNLFRFLANRDWSAVATIVSAWLAGILVTLFIAQTDLAATFEIAGFILAKANFWTQVYIGISAASIAGVLADAKKAVDQTDSAKMPPLIPSRSETPTNMHP